MNEIETQIRKETGNNEEIDFLKDFNTIKAECKDKKPEYKLTKGRKYWITAIKQEDKNVFVYLLNDVGEYAKYNIDYFRIDTITEYDRQYELFVCEGSKLLQPNCLKKVVDGKTYSKQYVYDNKINCEGCKYITLIATNLKKIEDKYFCQECYDKKAKNMLNCIICKSAFLSENNKKYEKDGDLCIKCFNNKNECKVDDLFIKERDDRFNVMGYKNNTFNNLNTRTFGVEFEMIVKGYLRTTTKAFVKELKSIDINGISLYEYVKQRHDGSLTERKGIEVITSVLRGDKGEEILRMLNKTFIKYFTTDKSCGQHIHLGVEDLNSKDIINLYYVYQKLEPVFKYYVREDRIGHRMCKKLEKKQTKTFEELHNKKKVKLFDDDELEFDNSYSAVINEHHYGINFSSIPEHNTLEIRLMEGHLDVNRLIEWIKLHQQIIEYVKDLRGQNISGRKIRVEEVLSGEVLNTYQKKKREYILTHPKDVVTAELRNLALRISDDEEEED